MIPQFRHMSGRRKLKSSKGYLLIPVAGIPPRAMDPAGFPRESTRFTHSTRVLSTSMSSIDRRLLILQMAVLLGSVVSPAAAFTAPIIAPAHAGNPLKHVINEIHQIEMLKVVKQGWLQEFLTGWGPALSKGPCTALLHILACSTRALC